MIHLDREEGIASGVVGGQEMDMAMGWYVDHREAVWSARGDWGNWPEAGWMQDEVADAIVVEALSRYLRGEPSWEAPPDLHRRPGEAEVESRSG